MQRDASVTARLPAQVKDAMVRAAEDDGRTLSQWMERLLIAHLEASGYLSDSSHPAKRASRRSRRP